MAVKKIVLLITEGYSSNVLYNKLNSSYEIDTVIVEKPLSRLLFIRKRIKKLGFIKVVGQLQFQLLIVPILTAFSKKRIAAIQNQFQLDNTPIPASKIKNVASVNSDGTLKLLQEINPALIIVNGTRIISKKLLAAVPGIFINMHAGITPKYRGVHGAYWALANDDKDNCGVTIHVVNQGIDTGAILYQKTIEPLKEDNFITYPILQLSAGLPLLMKATEDILNIKMQKIQISSESQLWYHPTIWQYLYSRFYKNIK